MEMLTLVKVLTQNGADVNAAATDAYYVKWTSLHFAIDKGQIDVVKVLIQSGADVNAQSNDGSALHLAAF